MRYLARELGLAGSTSEVFAKADELAEACNDVMTKLPISEKDEEKKVAVRHNARNRYVISKHGRPQEFLQRGFFAIFWLYSWQFLW